MSTTAAPDTAAPAIAWDSGVLRALYELTFTDPEREVAGVLAGVAAGESPTGMPLVRAAIPVAQAAVLGQAAHFVHETWTRVHSVMARHYPSLATVGWYVSRPGCGIALTDRDELNHTRWFAGLDQILLVVDPAAHRAGVYGWRQGRLTLLAAGSVTSRGVGARRETLPLAATALLLIIGTALGATAFILAQTLGG